MSAAIAIASPAATNPAAPKLALAARRTGDKQQPQRARIPQTPAAALAELGRLLDAATSEADGLAWISAHAGTWALLSASEEAALARRSRAGDTQAHEEMILRNLRLVLSMALRMQRYSGALDVTDLAQEGVVGLMRAAARFDPERGYRFTTYATWWIAQAMQRAVADTGHQIRLPVYLYHQRRILLRLRSALAEELRREPTLDELAAAANARPNARGELRSAGQQLTGEEVALILSSHQPLASLQAQVDRDSQSSEDARGRAGHNRRLGDLVADECADAAFETVEARTDGAWLMGLARYALRECSKRDQAIFFSRALHPEISLDTLGRRYHISRERVRQIEESVNATVRAAVIAVGAAPAGYVAETPPPKRRPGRQALRASNGKSKSAKSPKPKVKAEAR